LSGFSNPIIGGGGALVYPSIHSPDYVPGVSGWTINKDGSAEFNNASFRGSVTVGSAGGPQVIINEALSFQIIFLTPNGGPSDVFLISQMQNVILLPSNGAHELSPPLIGTLSVTFNDGNIAEGVLVLGGMTNGGGDQGLFTLTLSASGPLAGTWPGGILSGVYSTLGGNQLELFIENITDNAGNIMVPLSNPVGGISGQSLTGTQLYPGLETWHRIVGGVGFTNGWTARGGNYPPPAYRALADGDVEINLHVVAGTLTNGTAMWTMPTAYVPTSTQIMPVEVDSSAAPNATSGTPCLLIRGASDTTPGAVQTYNLGTVTTRVHNASAKYSLNWH
jgi:hypothetical protein